MSILETIWTLSYADQQVERHSTAGDDVTRVTYRAVIEVGHAENSVRGCHGVEIDVTLRPNTSEDHIEFDSEITRISLAGEPLIDEPIPDVWPRLSETESSDRISTALQVARETCVQFVEPLLYPHTESLLG